MTGCPENMAAPRPAIALLDDADPKVRVCNAAAACGIKIHEKTGLRWMLRGIDLGGGRRLKLESIKVGGQRLTTVAAMRRFLQLQQCVDSPSPVAVLTEVSADAVLAAHGHPRPKARTDSAAVFGGSAAVPDRSSEDRNPGTPR